MATSILLDEVNDRVIAFGSNATFSDEVFVLDAELNPLGSAHFPALCNNAAISPHTERLYLARFPFDSCPGSCGGPLTLHVFDSKTYASQASPAVPPGRFRNNECAYVAVLSPPGRPRNVTAVAAGSDVTLSWTNVGGASGFVLEVGFAAGRTDLQFHLGPESRLTVSGVPPGAYYLRVRGGNEFGGGRPSDEIRLAVP